MKFPKEFLLGASTAAHQVEGNNRYSDLWAQEQMEHSSFAEPSNDAVDHYHRYEEGHCSGWPGRMDTPERRGI